MNPKRYVYVLLLIRLESRPEDGFLHQPMEVGTYDGVHPRNRGMNRRPHPWGSSHRAAVPAQERKLEDPAARSAPKTILRASGLRFVWIRWTNGLLQPPPTSGGGSRKRLIPYLRWWLMHPAAAGRNEGIVWGS
jgi:hypothetical protein